MTEPQYGERFFATRDRLCNLIDGIRVLAAGTHTALDGQLSSDLLGSEIKRPVHFIALGEINAGKSSFLNGLMAHEMCPASALPLTRSVIRYRFGEAEAARAPSATDGEERLLPLDFLRKYSLTDTPGTNSGGEDHLEALASHAAAADLVFLVFSVSNPWCAATWDLLGRLPEPSLERVVLILQQADLRAAADLEVIHGHMADLSRKRIGRVLPVFPFSAKLARAAQREGSPAGWHAAGGARLAEFISEVIHQCPERRRMLEHWRGQAAAALSLVDDQLERRRRSLISHERFVDAVEGEIEELREEFVNRLSSHLIDVAEVFEREADGVSRLLHRRLRVIPSWLRLFTGDHTGAEMERLFIERLQHSIQSVAARDGGEVAAACADHWRQLGPRVAEEIDVEIDALPAIELTLDSARQRFIQNLGDAASQGIGNLRVRHQLDRELRKRNIALRSFLTTSLIFTIAGAVCGALGLPWLPLSLSGLALVFLGSGVMVAWLTRGRIKREFRQRLLDTCGAFAGTLRGDYEAALAGMFREYAACLAPLRSHLARHKLATEPHQRRWQELFLTLKEIEQDVGWK